MTHAFDPNRLQFYLTIPAPCPYLPGRMERKIFTQLDPLNGPQLNNYLTHAGFRRSQNVIYRPACENCKECRSLRICASEFRPSKNMLRILKNNADLERRVCEPIATEDQFNLLHSYLHERHKEGGMCDMDFFRYELMVEECSAETQIIEYRDPEDNLIACVLVDILMDGLSMVYSFFDTNCAKRSLGNLMILDQINRCREMNMAYVYLGYWVEGSPKMDYKIRYKPHEILSPYGWQKMEEKSEWNKPDPGALQPEEP